MDGATFNPELTAFTLVFLVQMTVWQFILQWRLNRTQSAILYSHAKRSKPVTSDDVARAYALSVWISLGAAAVVSILR